MNFFKVETLALACNTLEKIKCLDEYAQNERRRHQQEIAQIAERYPANTVKPKPINYCHYRLNLDNIVLNIADANQMLNEIGVLADTVWLGIAEPDKDSYTYLIYKWQHYYLLVPLCQDFLFITADLEKRLPAEIWKLEERPTVAANAMIQRQPDDEIFRICVLYNPRQGELVPERITYKGGPYLLNPHESTEKIRNLLFYLREKFCYDMNQENGHTDLPNSVRLN